jgi:RimJ/RimL family protein N-acetyltransferase
MNAPVCIRQYEESDLDEVIAAVHESLGELLPWMPWCSAAYSRSDAAAWIETTREGHVTGSMYDFAIIDGHGRYAGGCGLNQLSTASGVANLGYWVRSSAAGRGIAPAAVRQLVSWAIQNTTLNRFEIVIALGNTRSARVAEKAGAQRDAVLRKRLIVEGRPTDALLYSFVRPG